MAFPELQLIGRWTNTNTASTGLGKSPNTKWSPPPVLTNEPALPQGYLNGKQVGEVAYAVVYSPVTPAGAVEDLEYVRLVLDGTPYDFVWLSGRQDTNMAPKPSRIRRGKILSFGKPTFGRNGTPNGLLDATCPKFITSATVEAWAGQSAITQDYTVELWGYVYDSVQLATAMPVYSKGPVTIPDILNGRAFKVPGRTVTPSGGDWRNAWTQLMGGLKQSPGATGAVIHKLVRRSRNANATAVSTAYVFQYQNSSQTPAVENSQDNMYFQLEQGQAILAQRLGVRSPLPTAAGAALLASWIDTPGESQRQHPRGGIPVDFELNEVTFGLAAGETNKFDALPELPQGDQLLTNENCGPTVVDNGGSVAALAAMVGFSGVLIETVTGGVI